MFKIAILLWRTGWDSTCPAGQAGSRLWRAPGTPFTPAPVRIPRRESKKESTPFGVLSFLADRVGFEPTSLLRDYLISSVVLRTDFSGSWTKIAPLFGSPGEPSKPLTRRAVKAAYLKAILPAKPHGVKEYLNSPRQPSKWPPKPEKGENLGRTERNQERNTPIFCCWQKR